MMMRNSYDIAWVSRTPSQLAATLALPWCKPNHVILHSRAPLARPRSQVPPQGSAQFHRKLFMPRTVGASSTNGSGIVARGGRTIVVGGCASGKPWGKRCCGVLGAPASLLVWAQHICSPYDSVTYIGMKYHHGLGTEHRWLSTRRWTVGDRV